MTFRLWRCLEKKDIKQTLSLSCRNRPIYGCGEKSGENYKNNVERNTMRKINANSLKFSSDTIDVVVVIVLLCHLA